MEAASTNNSKLRRDPAKRRLQAAQDRVAAMAEYKAEGLAIREKTARLSAKSAPMHGSLLPGVRKPGLRFSLYSQAQKTCDYYYHDHHTDDVKDVHCVLLLVRDAICLRDGKSAIRAPSRLVMGVKALLETMRSSANVSLYKNAHCNLLRAI